VLAVMGVLWVMCGMVLGVMLSRMLMVFDGLQFMTVGHMGMV